jgi:hypothetical protein
MRPLSELVKFRNDLVSRLEQLSLVEPIGKIIQKLNLTVTENFDVEAFTAHDKITQALVDYQKILDQSEFVRNNLKSVIGDIDIKINELATQFNDTYDHFVAVDPDASVTFVLDPIIHQLIKDRMSHYADWRFPGLRLGCRYSGQSQIDNILVKDYSLSVEYSNALVANDPLYFCEFRNELIDNSTKHFNDVYGKRIRKYIIKDHDLTLLPQNQFSFVFAWWIFNYANITVIEQYLRSIFNLLCPGGTVMFSYNNGEIVESARLADENKMSFIPKQSLVRVLTQIGYEIIASYDEQNQDPSIPVISWVELRKSGELKTIRLKQVIGAIGQK